MSEISALKGIQKLPSLSKELDGISCKIDDLGRACSRLGLKEFGVELKSYAAYLERMRLDLLAIHTEEVNIRVKSAEEATVNMITAALNSIPGERI